jgi:hypothetical protein
LLLAQDGKRWRRQLEGMKRCGLPHITYVGAARAHALRRSPRSRFRGLASPSVTPRAPPSLRPPSPPPPPPRAQLIEGELDNLGAADNERLRAALSELEVAHGFHVVMPTTHSATQDYLALSTARLLEGQFALSVGEVLAKPGTLTWDGLVMASKPPRLVWSTWAQMLLHIPGLSDAGVQALLDKGWHTPRALLDALRDGGPRFAEEAIEPGRKRRKLSADMHGFFTALSYAERPEL